MDGELDAFIKAYLLGARGARGVSDAERERRRSIRQRARQARSAARAGHRPVRRALRGHPLGAAAPRAAGRRRRGELRPRAGERGRPRGGAASSRQDAASLHLMDQTGRIQLYARADRSATATSSSPGSTLGDFIGVTGELFRTRTGELTVAREGLHVPGQVAPPAAREVARPQGRRDALPPALRRPDREPGGRATSSAALARS